ncbi:MAG TPA: nitronate monooxygenase [Ignavibacteria bacterium]|nr:nitronate monooxygenase [Ignavibacteria bacterium]HMQ99660.1 nitronate monooxygenase [Ignavibacteria bacterium]
MKQTRVNTLFGIEHAIIQAGMVWTSGWRLASAASENGCLGLIGAGSMKPELLSEHITKLRNYFKEKNITKPFGVNLPLIRGDIDELIKTILKEEVKIVFSSAGNPKAFSNLFKDNGITWVHVVASVKHALKAQEAGCDAVVAEGFEAGGHNGIDEITTLCLVPQVAAALNIPVIAAGGIATGGQIAACIAMGAEGVQIGTRFAATTEASSSEAFKNIIVEAKDSDTYLIMKKLNPVRLYKNKFANDVINAERSGASADELREILGRKREMKGIFEGDLDDGELEMGQSSGLVNDILPVKIVVRNLLKEYETAVSSF